jgi:putative cardiolipin synthase
MLAGCNFLDSPELRVSRLYNVESPELAQQVIEYMEEGVRPENAYRVLLDEDGELYWVTEVDGNAVRYTQEPESTFGQRFMSGFIMMLPVEHQL